MVNVSLIIIFIRISLKNCAQLQWDMLGYVRADIAATDYSQSYESQWLSLVDFV